MADPKEKVLRINVCGRLFEFDRKSLAKNKRATFLRKFARLSHEDRENLADLTLQKPTRIYFIWRSPKLFECVLSYISTGHIHCPDGVCTKEFIDELRFWEISLPNLPTCCREKLELSESELHRYMDEAFVYDETAEKCSSAPEDDHSHPSNGQITQFLMQEKEDLEDDDPAKEENYAEFDGICWGSERRIIWIALEDPHSGIIAKVLTAVSAGFVFVSVILLILGSMVEFQDEEKEPIEPLIRTEYVCVAWFTLEYIVRLLITPLRWNFIKSPINIVDALSLFPFYLEVCFLLAGKGTTDDLQNWKGALLAMRVLRVLRVARVLKLARYSGGLKSFGTTLSSSKKEIGMLLMFLSTAMLLFSTSVYFFEKDHDDTPFTSIPATFWWAVVTMTTVGYGDMIPVSVGGKLVAGFATISGVIVLAFPITMIVENFNQHYQREGPDVERQIGTLHVKSVAII